MLVVDQVVKDTILYEMWIYVFLWIYAFPYSVDNKWYNLSIYFNLPAYLYFRYTNDNHFTAGGPQVWNCVAVNPKHDIIY